MRCFSIFLKIDGAGFDYSNVLDFKIMVNFEIKNVLLMISKQVLIKAK